MPSRAQVLDIVVGHSVGLVGMIVCFYVLKKLGIFDPFADSKDKAKEQAKKLIEALGIDESIQLNEYEMTIAACLIDPLSMKTSWQDIGGLSSVINSIKESVVLPLNYKNLFASSSLLSAPKGILLYGPPGCGKTMIAKATTKETGCRFINLDVAKLTEKWYGESNKLAAAVFSLAYKIQPCVIFIDEIDSFLRARNTQDHEATAMMKAQFMSLWDGMISETDAQVIVMAATNRPHDIDQAILRRLPCRFKIGLPDLHQRKEILEVILRDEEICEEKTTIALKLAQLTDGYSGSDLKELCREAALECLRKQMDEINNSDEMEEEAQEMTLPPMKMQDFNEALARMKRNRNVLYHQETVSAPLD